MPTRDADIVIIGAGIAGASTGYHLRRQRGDAAHVVLLEQESAPGMHSTGRNAAIIRDVCVDEDIRLLLEEGARFLASRQLATFERCGLWLAGEGDGEIASRFPQAGGKGTWFEHCGVADVAGLLESYLRGQEVRLNTRVLGFQRRGEAMVVETSQGALRCRLVVNAAGPWAGRLGGLPLAPLNRTLFQTPPMESIGRSWPVVWHGREGLYFRPESGGLLMSVCEETPAEPGDYREDPARLEELAEKLERLQPGLADISIRTSWVGQRTFAPDRNFVIGFDPREAGLFHVCGLGGHGITSSYAVGRLAAELIEAGPEAASPYAPGRLLGPG